MKKNRNFQGVKLELGKVHVLSIQQLTLLQNIASLSESLNTPAYLVGGFVRDYFLKKQVTDLDIVVEGDAIEFGQAVVKKYGGKLTPHTKFRTAVWHTFLTLGKQAVAVDLITARKEVYKIPGALPTVKPSTIDDDLRRRDFTINAMAVNLDGDQFGELLDPLDGYEDLKQKLIRVLHSRSFMDDPTRIFRAVRYELRFNFNMHPSTRDLINDESFAILKTLSSHRIRHEIDLIFQEEQSARMLARLHELGVFEIFDPPLPKFNVQYSDFLNSKAPVEFNVPENRVMTGYLLWLMDSQMDGIEFLSNRLDFPSELKQAALSIIRLKNNLSSMKNSRPSELTLQLEEYPSIAVHTLWLVSGESILENYFIKWRHVKQKTTGKDLKARGLEPGPRYREILSRLRAARLDGEVKNDREEGELLESLM
jgi:tRNA nucleotidyltransferase (CCA-adding enzyme)